MRSPPLSLTSVSEEGEAQRGEKGSGGEGGCIVMHCNCNYVPELIAAMGVHIVELREYTL